MKKLNFKTQVIAISVTILTAALMQACGSGSSSAALPVGNTINNPLGGPIGSGGPLNSGLYQACTGPGGQSYGQYGVNVTSANMVTSADSAQVPVCQVVMEIQLQPIEYSSRAFLGPNAGSSIGIPSGLALVGNDSAVITAVGSYGSGVFSGLNGCSGNTIQDTGDVYGAVSGLNPFPLGHAISVPAFGGGSVMVGLNQSPGSSGCMVLQISAEVQRCVDSSGNTHPCPSPL